MGKNGEDWQIWDSTASIDILNTQMIIVEESFIARLPRTVSLYPLLKRYTAKAEWLSHKGSMMKIIMKVLAMQMNTANTGSDFVSFS